MESKESEVTVAIIIASCNSAFEELQKNKNFSLSDSLAQECVNIAKGNINLSSAINLSKDKEGYITLLNFAAMILDKYIMIFKTQMPTFPQYKEIMKNGFNVDYVQIVDDGHYNLDEWWYSSEVQKTVKEYCEQFANTSDNCIDVWTEELARHK